ncbi:MAG: permease prefix domain 1-containing protein [Coprobacillaceae bacterium]
MNDELRKYLDKLFEDAPKTRASYELKEELLANSTEKYSDLVESGIPEGEALHIVMDSIGDIEQLFETMETTEKKEAIEVNLKKKALFRTTAIGLYILGFILAIIVDEVAPVRYDFLGGVSILVMAAIATCILVYESIAYPKYKKENDTVVENFKEWNHNKKANKEIKNAVNVIIWMCTLVAYFILSFMTMAWYITWVIFLIGVCAQAIASLLFQIKDNKE